MKEKIISIVIVAVFAVILGSCDDNKGAEEPGITLAGEGTHIAGLTGRLYYSSYYKMWVAKYAYPGTIDSVDEYLIIDGIDDEVPTNTSISVTFSGDYYQSGLGSAVAGRTIYYITNFKYKQI
jgi:hypothetical protein